MIIFQLAAVLRWVCFHCFNFFF